MKNLILGFLVFITTFLNAQSVDPETFPTVVGAISGKNLYTNTGGEGKISVQSIIDSAKLDTAVILFHYTGTTVGNLLVVIFLYYNGFPVTVYDQMEYRLVIGKHLHY